MESFVESIFRERCEVAYAGKTKFPNEFPS